MSWVRVRGEGGSHLCSRLIAVGLSQSAPSWKWDRLWASWGRQEPALGVRREGEHTRMRVP